MARKPTKKTKKKPGHVARKSPNRRQRRATKVREAATPTRPKDTASYEAHKERARSRSATLAAQSQDIGDLPPVANPARREKARLNFRFFCLTYHAELFTLPFSPDHDKIIEKIEEAVLRGGLFAMAMPRGSGKTTITECACEWATLYGHREYVALIGSDEGHAEKLLSSLESEFKHNDLLALDFPEICVPIRRLEGINQRSIRYRGEIIDMDFSQKMLILPNMPDAPGGSAIIEVRGITGGIRGMKHKRPDGRACRPDLVIIDDPQTDESAHSLKQCRQRLRILTGAILGLAGPGKKIAGVVPCTVIAPGDVADEILDRQKHPEFNGERTRMVYAFPKRLDLWDQYREIREDGMRREDGGKSGTEFYRKNRKEMDELAVVAWPERHNTDELSAIQHAMNLKFLDEAAFSAEYQNDPLPEQTETPAEELSVELVGTKVNGLARGSVVTSVNHLTMFIDVHKEALYWVVAGWEQNFTGYVVDYGTFPDQKQRYFALRDVQHTLSDRFPGTGLEGSIYAGLGALALEQLGREWKRDDGAALRVTRCLIDANWGRSTHVVKKFCRQSAYATVLRPSHGHGIGASGRPMSDWPKKEGEQRGLNWMIRRGETRGDVRHIVWDVNYWKSHVAQEFRIAQGDRGCLSLFQGTPTDHRLFAEHCTSEFAIRTHGRGRAVDEWKLRPGTDNHYWDCLVGAAVAGSELGCEALEGTGSLPKKPRMKLSEIQASKRKS